MLSDQENNGLALIFLIDKRGRELQLGGCAIIVSDPLAEPASRSVAARAQLAAESAAKIDITQTADNEPFVSFFMAASVSALNPTCKSQNCVALFSPNESSTTRARQPVTDLPLPMWCSRHSQRGPVRAEFAPIARPLSLHRSHHVRGKLRAPPISRLPQSTARRSQ